MKARIVLAVMFVVVFLLPGGTASAAGGISGITGSINLEPPDWGSYYRVWIEFSVHQVDPSTDEANGMIVARVYNPEMGWKHLWYEAKCVSFGEVDGKPAATVVAMIVRREGWDDIPTAGDPGEYLKWQLVDGGTPAGSGDVWRLQWYDFGNFVEYWPTYPDGGCRAFRGDETDYPDHGDLVIH
jgi:hypothetical protein